MGRLATPDALPPRSRTHLLVALEGDGGGDPDGVVVGGVVVEHYRRSCCGQLTYLAIEPSYRRQGVAGRLLEAVAKLLQREATAERSVIRAVFAECDDPRSARALPDVVPPWQRVEILARLGAWWVDVPYVQPSLGEGKSRVHSLLLLAFPGLVSPSAPLPDRELLQEFLCEFFEDLGVREPLADQDLIRTLSSLEEGPLPLKALATLRQSEQK